LVIVEKFIRSTSPKSELLAAAQRLRTPTSSNSELLAAAQRYRIPHIPKSIN